MRGTRFDTLAEAESAVMETGNTGLPYKPILMSEPGSLWLNIPFR